MKMKSFKLWIKTPKVRKPMPKPSRPISQKGYSRKSKHKKGFDDTGLEL
jgi:hypothetical protein